VFAVRDFGDEILALAVALMLLDLGSGVGTGDGSKGAHVKIFLFIVGMLCLVAAVISMLKPLGGWMPLTAACVCFGAAGVMESIEKHAGPIAELLRTAIGPR
jgi:hypothetical protein